PESSASPKPTIARPRFGALPTSPICACGARITLTPICAAGSTGSRPSLSPPPTSISSTKTRRRPPGSHRASPICGAWRGEQREETLGDFDRFPAMRQDGGSLRLSATDLANHLACLHLSHLDRAEARGRLRPPDYYDPDAAVLRERGSAHEEAFLR